MHCISSSALFCAERAITLFPRLHINSCAECRTRPQESPREHGSKVQHAQWCEHLTISTAQWIRGYGRRCPGGTTLYIPETKLILTGLKNADKDLNIKWTVKICNNFIVYSFGHCIILKTGPGSYRWVTKVITPSKWSYGPLLIPVFLLDPSCRY